MSAICWVDSIYPCNSLSELFYEIFPNFLQLEQLSSHKLTLQVLDNMLENFDEDGQGRI